MWFILVENHDLELTNSFWSWPFHFGRDQIIMVKSKSSQALICSWHQKKRNHQFTNLKCCKMYLKGFKMKRQGLKCFQSIWIRNNTLLQRGFKRLAGLFAVHPLNSWIGEFMVSCFFDVYLRTKLFPSKGTVW